MAGTLYLDTSAILRALDALNLATFVLARRRIEDLEMLTVDDRMRDAAGAA